MNIDVYIKYLVHLLRCAVSGEQAQDMPEGMDAQKLFKLSRYHKVENVAYMALEKTDTSKIPQGVYKLFQEFYNHAITVEATQQYYLEQMLDEFEAEGIDYLVLKGREIACLYPSSDMRQSSDLDVYVGRDGAMRARPVMEKLGYNVEAYSDTDDDHDEYRMNNLVYCELHRVLIQNNYPWQEECNKITDRLLRPDPQKHCMKMSDEDFYIYNLAHTAKHMKFSGIGIKVFLDLWLIYNHYKDRLDMEYLSKKLEQCHLAEFDKNARELCEYWFEGKEDVDDKIKKMSRYVVQSGWMGTHEQAKSTELAEKAGKTNSTKVAKIKKCIDIILSPYESMAARYPILKKHKWLTPFCRIHRGLSAALFKRDLVKNVTGELDNGDMTIGKKILEFKQSIGL